MTRGICSLRSRRTGAGVEGCDGEYSGGWRGGSLASLHLSFCPSGWGAALYSEWRDVGPDAGLAVAVGHGDRDGPVPVRSGRLWVCGCQGQGQCLGPRPGLAAVLLDGKERRGELRGVISLLLQGGARCWEPGGGECGQACSRLVTSSMDLDQFPPLENPSKVLGWGQRVAFLVLPLSLSAQPLWEFSSSRGHWGGLRFDKHAGVLGPAPQVGSVGLDGPRNRASNNPLGVEGPRGPSSGQGGAKVMRYRGGTHSKPINLQGLVKSKGF